MPSVASTSLHSHHSVPEVSLIVSVYNQASGVKDLITTIVLQEDAPSFESIFCDDGSCAEEVSTILRQLQGSPLDCLHVWQPHEGFRLSRSRNNAVRCARGRLLLFVDGDVLLPKNFIRDHFRAHDQSDLVVCGSRRSLFPTRPQQTLQSTLRNPEVDVIDFAERQSKAYRSSAPWSVLLGCNFSVAKSPQIVFDENFVGWGYEDWELACRLATTYDIRLDCSPALTVTHYEQVPLVDQNPLRPQSAEEIALFMRNLVYFCRLYPDRDMSLVWQALTLLEPNEDGGGMWSYGKNDPKCNLSLREKVRLANEWFDSKLT